MLSADVMTTKTKVLILDTWSPMLASVPSCVLFAFLY